MRRSLAVEGIRGREVSVQAPKKKRVAGKVSRGEGCERMEGRQGPCLKVLAGHSVDCGIFL